jgi:hypothetical protein
LVFLQGFFGVSSGIPPEMSKISRRTPEETPKKLLRKGELISNQYARTSKKSALQR